MAKATHRKHLKDNGQPLIENRAEANKVAEAMFGDSEDLVSIVEEDATQEAIDTLTDLQTAVEALLEYYHNKE